MKTQKFLPILLILLATFQIFLGQEKPQAFLFDEMGKPCNEDLSARYDGFLIALSNDPSAIGYIVLYGDKEAEGRNLNYLKFLTKYLTFRNFDKSRIVQIRGENQSKMKMEFWIVPAGANPPKPAREFIEQKITLTTLFDKNWADFHKDFDGKLQIYSNDFADLGCEFSPNVSEFAKTLLSSQDLTGYLIVYTKFGKGLKRGKQVANFAVNDLVKNHKVPRNRLKTIYGGNREEPQIELWFVPQNEKPPTPKPDLKPKK